MKTPEEIEALRKRIAELHDELTAAKQQLFEAQVALCPVQIGGLVKSINGSIHKVAFIKPMAGKFWVYAVPTLKSGAFGKREVLLYDDWEPV